MSLSVSQIKQFEDCPRAWYYSYVLRLPQIKSPALKKGSDLHEIFDKSYLEAENSLRLQGKEITFENVIKEIKNIYIDYKVPEYRMSINGFINFNEQVQMLPIMRERKLLDKELDVVGIIDRVDKTPTKIIITDYKTGKEEPIENHTFQLAVYANLYENEYKEKPTHGGILYTETGTFLCQPFNEEMKQEAKDRIEFVRKLIKEAVEKNIFNKNISWKCRRCSYQDRCKTEK